MLTCQPRSTQARCAARPNGPVARAYARPRARGKVLGAIDVQGPVCCAPSLSLSLALSLFFVVTLSLSLSDFSPSVYPSAPLSFPSPPSPPPFLSTFPPAFLTAPSRRWAGVRILFMSPCRLLCGESPRALQRGAGRTRKRAPMGPWHGPMRVQGPVARSSEPYVCRGPCAVLSLLSLSLSPFLSFSSSSLSLSLPLSLLSLRLPLWASAPLFFPSPLSSTLPFVSALPPPPFSLPTAPSR